MSINTLQLKILTPLGSVYDKEVDQVTVTTTSGEITLLKDHIPLVTVLKVGQVMIKKDNQEEYFAISGGVLEKRHDNTVIILSSRSESANEIDLERSEKAYERAKKLMEDNSPSANINYSHLQKIMSKELNRLHIGQKGRRK